MVFPLLLFPPLCLKIESVVFFLWSSLVFFQRINQASLDLMQFLLLFPLLYLGEQKQVVLPLLGVV